MGRWPRTNSPRPSSARCRCRAQVSQPARAPARTGRGRRRRTPRTRSRAPSAEPGRVGRGRAPGARRGKRARAPASLGRLPCRGPPRCPRRPSRRARARRGAGVVVHEPPAAAASFVCTSSAERGPRARPRAPRAAPRLAARDGDVRLVRDFEQQRFREVGRCHGHGVPERSARVDRGAWSAVCACHSLPADARRRAILPPAPRHRRRHRHLGRHVRAGAGRARAIPAVRVPRGAVRDLDGRARAVRVGPAPGAAREGYVAGVGAGALLAAAYGFQTAGLELTTVTSTGFITGLYVVFTPFIALALFRTPVRARSGPASALAVVGLFLLFRPGAGRGQRARPRRSARRRAPDRRPRAVRAPLRRARPDVPADGDVLRRVPRARARARGARGPARRHGLGRTARHRALRRGARLPRRDLGAGADDRALARRSSSRSRRRSPRWRACCSRTRFWAWRGGSGAA